MFKRFYDQGDIYKGSYEGQYCTECEAFYTEAQLADGKCPVCGSGLLVRKTRKGSKTFYVCDKKGTNPDCEFISWDLPIDDKKCETCGSYMVWHRFRGKTYPRCSNAECETNKRKKKSDKDESDE